MHRALCSCVLLPGLLGATRTGLIIWNRCFPGLKQPWALGRYRFAVWVFGQLHLESESAQDNQVEEFRNGTQKKWLTAFWERTG
jgi:hypothetical protein